MVCEMAACQFARRRHTKSSQWASWLRSRHNEVRLLEDNAPPGGSHYDHLRSHAQVHGYSTHQHRGKPKIALDDWDFVFTRADMTRFWLHPQWGDNLVRYGEVRESAVSLEPPPRGRGVAALPGEGQVYKHYKFARTEDKLKLDREKNEVKGKQRPEVIAAIAAGRGRGSGNHPPPLPQGPPPQPQLFPGPEPEFPQPTRECQ